MKKILISIIIILLIGLGCTICVKSLNIGTLKLESVSDIKNASSNLEQKFKTSNEISAQTYPNSIENLDKVVRSLKDVKQKYEAKTMNNPGANAAIAYKGQCFFRDNPRNIPLSSPLQHAFRHS